MLTLADLRARRLAAEVEPAEDLDLDLPSLPVPDRDLEPGNLPRPVPIVELGLACIRIDIALRAAGAIALPRSAYIAAAEADLEDAYRAACGLVLGARERLSDTIATLERAYLAGVERSAP